MINGLYSTLRGQSQATASNIYFPGNKKKTNNKKYITFIDLINMCGIHVHYYLTLNTCIQLMSLDDNRNSIQEKRWFDVCTAQKQTSYQSTHNLNKWMEHCTISTTVISYVRKN